MFDAVNKVSSTGDATGGVVEVIATYIPAGLGEPVFEAQTKLEQHPLTPVLIVQKQWFMV